MRLWKIRSTELTAVRPAASCNAQRLAVFPGRNRVSGIVAAANAATECTIDIVSFHQPLVPASRVSYRLGRRPHQGRVEARVALKEGGASRLLWRLVLRRLIGVIAW